VNKKKTFSEIHHVECIYIFYRWLLTIGVFVPDRGDQMEAARAGIMSPAAHLRGEAFPHFTPGVPVREALPHITPGLTGHHVLTVTAFSRDQVPRFSLKKQ